MHSLCVAFYCDHRLPIYQWIVSICRRTPLAVLMFAAACAKPCVYPSPGDRVLPKLEESHALMEDGYRLPLSRWEAIGNKRAIVLALHGLNDYSHAFDNLGQYLIRRGITVIACDQRGFGNTAGHGYWHGSERLGADLLTLITLLRTRYTDVPLYLLGDSMGGAVVLSSLASAPLDVDGIILVAPAVWTRASMPFYQQAALWTASHTFPGLKLTGDGLDIQASDNLDMLRALSSDELVIKATRVDVLHGMSNLMDSAMLASNKSSGDILLLYGKHDQIIPAAPICKLFETLSSSTTTRLTAIIYEDGFHMLTRDLQAEAVLEDIASWVGAHQKHRHDHHADDMRSYCASLD